MQIALLLPTHPQTQQTHPLTSLRYRRCQSATSENNNWVCEDVSAGYS